MSTNGSPHEFLGPTAAAIVRSAGLCFGAMDCRSLAPRRTYHKRRTMNPLLEIRPLDDPSGGPGKVRQSPASEAFAFYTFCSFTLVSLNTALPPTGSVSGPVLVCSSRRIRAFTEMPLPRRLSPFIVVPSTTTSSEPYAQWP
jgi:hypothetical protein